MTITFKIGQQVYRQDPGGHETPFHIQGEEDVKYHTELQAKGYRYTVAGETEVDFELPEVKGDLRIHRKPFEECESCSS